jgi:hypothetical protein
MSPTSCNELTNQCLRSDCLLMLRIPGKRQKRSARLWSEAVESFLFRSFPNPNIGNVRPSW